MNELMSSNGNSNRLELRLGLEFFIFLKFIEIF